MGGVECLGGVNNGVMGYRANSEEMGGDGPCVGKGGRVVFVLVGANGEQEMTKGLNGSGNMLG